MKNLSVRWRLAGFVGFLLLLMIAAGVGGITGMYYSNQALSSIYSKQVLSLRQLRELDYILNSKVLGTAHRIMLGELPWREGLEEIKDAKEEFSSLWQDFLRVEEQNPQYEVHQRILDLSPIIKDTEDHLKKLIIVLEQQDKKGLADLIESKELVRLADLLHDRIQLVIQDRLAAAKEEFDKAQSWYFASKKAFILTLMLGFLISLVAGVLLIRGINEPLMKMAKAMKKVREGDLTQRLNYDREDEFKILIDGFNRMSDYLSELVSQAGIRITSAITQIAATIKQQEASINEQAAIANEIAASTSEIAATASSLLHTMKNVTALTKDTAEAASQGHAGLSRMDETMGRMEDATGSIVSKLAVLSEKAGNIAGVVKTINKIADQTNLLSLNAAIEAEKAGEYGTGFAVVANEIRRLADQTAIATYDIEKMVQDVQSAVSAGVMGMDKFADEVRRSADDIRQIGSQLAQVIEKVQELMPHMEAVSEGMESQSLGAQQISEAVNKLNETAQQTAESLHQTSDAIAQLQDAARGLQDRVSRFKLD